VGLRAGLDGCGKSRPPTGIRSPDSPARSEVLYRLSYPGPLLFTSISCFFAFSRLCVYVCLKGFFLAVNRINATSVCDIAFY